MYSKSHYFCVVLKNHCVLPAVDIVGNKWTVLRFLSSCIHLFDLCRCGSLCRQIAGEHLCRNHTSLHYTCLFVENYVKHCKVHALLYAYFPNEKMYDIMKAYRQNSYLNTRQWWSVSITYDWFWIEVTIPSLREPYPSIMHVQHPPSPLGVRI